MTPRNRLLNIKPWRLATIASTCCSTDRGASREAIRPEGNHILVRFRSRLEREQEEACFPISFFESRSMILGPDARSSQILSDTPQPFEKLVGVDCMKCER